MRCMRLALFEPSGIEHAASFIVALVPLLKRSKKLELKHAMCESIAHILSQANAMPRNKEASYTQLHTAMSEVYNKAAAWSKKSKHAASAYPLVAELLCAKPVDVFRKGAPQLLDGLFRLARERKTWSAAIDCTHRVLRVLLWQWSWTPQFESTKSLVDVLQDVCNGLFGSKKQQLPLEAVADLASLIKTVARSQLEFVVQETYVLS